MNSIKNLFNKKECVDILELDYDCPNCGIVDSINNTKEDGNQTIKCGKCNSYIRLNGKTVDKPGYIIKREEIDKEYNKLKEETSGLFLNISPDNYRSKIDRMHILYRERERIGSIKVVKYCNCGRHLSTSSSSL